MRLGIHLGELLAAGDVVGLAGELGAGKTLLTKGIARGVGVRPEEVRSQTFTLLSRHEGGRLPLIHVDAYRLSGPQDLVDLGLEEIFDPAGAAVIEWAPRVAAALPTERLDVRLEHAGESARRLTFEGRGARGEALVRALRERLSGTGTGTGTDEGA